MAFCDRWIEQLLARYNAERPEALGIWAGRLWLSRKVAKWMAAELGLISAAPQRGWPAESRVPDKAKHPR